MYINDIQIENFRTFSSQKQAVAFIHPKQNFQQCQFPEPTLTNVNLLLGDNGSGKSSLLKAIALSALGPTVGQSGIYPYRFVRLANQNTGQAFITATFIPNEQDNCRASRLNSKVQIEKQDDLENLIWCGDNSEDEMNNWRPLFSERSEAMFMVAYGANRRIEKPDRLSPSRRSSERARRIMSLFEEDYALRPLSTWLPTLEFKHPAHYKEVISIINTLLNDSHFKFTGKQSHDDEYVLEEIHSQTAVPFPALSDGYRAYIGWISDLLFHVSNTCPANKSIIENRGIVMVDEIDLHLHPQWQMRVLPDLAKSLPHVQFIATSHSPLVVGSLEWMNILVMKPNSDGSACPTRIQQNINGLDADQVLLTDMFGMSSTRAATPTQQLLKLSEEAAQGNKQSAKALLRMMTHGTDAKK